MAVYLRPGVFVEETLNPTTPAVGAASQSVAAFIGASDRGPVVPTLVTSWSQYVSLFGSWNTRASNDFPIGVFMFFSNGGSQAYIQRVVDSEDDTAASTVVDEDLSLIFEIYASSPGVWGNSIAISLLPNAVTNTFDLIIFYNGVANSNIVERYTDLSTDPTAERFVASVVNSQSKYVVIEFLNDLVPVAINGAFLSGVTADATITETMISGAVESFDVVSNSLILNAPGVTSADAINEILGYADSRGDVFVIIDSIDDTVTNQLVLSQSYNASSYGAVYYPRIVIKDPTVTTPNVTKLIPPGGAVVGKFVSTDAARGVYKAPAGLGVRLANAVSVKPLTNAELDALNSDAAAVNAIRFIQGSGIVVMGARTLKGGYADRYIPGRRTLIYLRKALVDLTQFAIFEPNDQRLWRQLTSVVESFLTNFWQEGGLRGDEPSQAYFVKCDNETNTISSIDSGEVRLEVGVALQRPAEFVVIKIGQFDGGTTVTIA